MRNYYRIMLGRRSDYAGEVVGGYAYHKGQELPHRRAVRWFPRIIARDEMSEQLRNSTGAIGTVSARSSGIWATLKRNWQKRTKLSGELLLPLRMTKRFVERLL